MEVILIMGTSGLLQIIAAFLFWKLIRVTGHRLPWVFIAASLCGFAFWNGIQIYAVISENPLLSWPNFPDEIVEMISSIFIVVGAFYATPLFISIKRSREDLKGSAEKLRYLTSQLLIAQELERKRIAMELHDELGQALLVLKLQFSAIGDGLRKDQKSLAEGVQHSLAYLDSLLNNVRRLSCDLCPSVLEQAGLSQALRQLLDEFGRQHKSVQCRIDIDDIDDLIASGSQIGLYRVLQECLTNIGKHAHATKVAVAVKRQEGCVSFRVEDNGSGFNMSQVVADRPAGGGMGLAAMNERVRMLGGAMGLVSEVGKGTKISFSVPVEPGEKRGLKNSLYPLLGLKI